MLQQINPKFNIKKLALIHFDHEGNETEYGQWEIENAKAFGKWRFPNSFEDMCSLLIKEFKVEWNKGE